MNNIFRYPFGNIETPEQFGKAIRARRRAQKVTQAELAAICGVGTRFVSELERGKPTMALGKVLAVIQGVGLDLHLVPRGWSAADDER